MANDPLSRQEIASALAAMRQFVLAAASLSMADVADDKETGGAIAEFEEKDKILRKTIRRLESGSEK